MMHESSAAAGRESPSARLSEGVLVLVVVLLIPIALYVVHLAPAERYLYPACNLALAIFLLQRRSPWYAGHVVLIFCCVSLVRRLVDEQAGWDAHSPILLTPYLCGLLAGFEFLKYWRSRQPKHIGPFLIVLLATLYGVLLAAANGRVLASMVDLLKWSIGPTFAVYILSLGSEQAKTRQVVENCLVWAGTAMAVYGILQFVRPPPWDVQWALSIIDSGMESLGTPAPFEMRAFSTMNSSGSFGAMMSCGIVLALKRRMPIAVPTVTLMATGLAICQYRAVWAGTVVAIVLIIIARPQALRPSNILAAMAAVLVLGTTALSPQIREAVAQRAATLNNISTDVSFEDRLRQYEHLSSDNDLITGLGLGLNGSARKMDDLPRLIIDGGLIEILRSIGVVFGTAYLLSLGALVAGLFRRDPAVAKDLDFDRALVVATLVQLPMGSVHVGELGFCAWMFIGFGLATLSSARATRLPALRSAEGNTVKMIGSPG
jgi:hypothetical protein